MHDTNTRKGKSNVWCAKEASPHLQTCKMFHVAKQKENNVVNI